MRHLFHRSAPPGPCVPHRATIRERKETSRGVGLPHATTPLARPSLPRATIPPVKVETNQSNNAGINQSINRMPAIRAHTLAKSRLPPASRSRDPHRTLRRNHRRLPLPRETRGARISSLHRARPLHARRRRLAPLPCPTRTPFLPPSGRRPPRAPPSAPHGVAPSGSPAPSPSRSPPPPRKRGARRCRPPPQGARPSAPLQRPVAVQQGRGALWPTGLS